MACQCNVCVGTGRCKRCGGTGEVEGSESRSYRRTRWDRFNSPNPLRCGVWRYQTASAVKSLTKPMTEGERVAKGESVPAIPECAEEKIWPCTAESWRPCDKCCKLVCEKHSYLIPVWPCEDAASEPADMVCRECVEELWARGDISAGDRTQYLF
jgi:hypothetical protein